MKTRFAISVLLLVLVIPRPAHAILGIGDTAITYDPENHAELTAIYNNAVQTYQSAMKMYETAKSSLQTMVSVENTIKQAQQAYEQLSTLDLGKTITQFQNDGSNLQSFAQLQARVYSAEGTISQTGNNLSYNVSRLNQVANLKLVQTATAKNTAQANGTVNTLTAEKITAQSTSTLATLAAVEAERQANKDVEDELAAQAALKRVDESKSVYSAMGAIK